MALGTFVKTGVPERRLPLPRSIAQAMVMPDVHLALSGMAALLTDLCLSVCGAEVGEDRST
mgnify:CR=1 FL=1